MSSVDRPDGWGPSHQTEPRRRWIARPPVLVAALGAVGLIVSAIHFGVTVIAVALIVALVMVVVIDAVLASRARPRGPRRPATPGGQDPLRAIRTLAARAGGGVWLGAGDDGEWRFAAGAGSLAGRPAAVRKNERRDHPGGAGARGSDDRDLDQAGRRPRDCASAGA
jgi:hypothetical protein